jgi:hypothetical protein
MWRRGRSGAVFAAGVVSGTISDMELSSDSALCLSEWIHRMPLVARKQAAPGWFVVAIATKTPPDTRRIRASDRQRRAHSRPNSTRIRRRLALSD